VTEELEVPSAAGPLAATLSAPAGEVIGGLVPLHPADGPSRHHFLLEHLAATLPALGIAVLRYDRRSGDDVPLRAQAEDAAAAADALRRAIASTHLDVGFWGFSQGGWAALLAAVETGASFLVLVSASSVSPAQQMRFGTSEQLRRAGHDADELTELDALRDAFERYQRGDLSRERAERAVRDAARRPWFDLAWVPRDLPEPGSWADMDFDPVEALRRVRCPILAFYGEDDEWVPVDRSIELLSEAKSEVTVIRLAGTGHQPTLAKSSDISPTYVRTLTGWLRERVAPGAP
jgi:uncharacterized protein